MALKGETFTGRCRRMLTEQPSQVEFTLSRQGFETLVVDAERYGLDRTKDQDFIQVLGDALIKIRAEANKRGVWSELTEDADGVLGHLWNWREEHGLLKRDDIAGRMLTVSTDWDGRKLACQSVKP